MKILHLLFALLFFGMFAVEGFVYAQTDAATPGRQLQSSWERSALRDEKKSIIEGNAVLVFDGQTIGVVAKDGSKYTVRLRGIDTPENRQPFGVESASQLAYLVQGMNVVVIVNDLDQRNHYVGSVILDGEDLSLTQIRRGMAWNRSKGVKTMTKEQRDTFARAEEKARSERVGIWSSPDPIAPWVFRGEPVDVAPKATADSAPVQQQDATPKSSVPTDAATATAAKPPVATKARTYILGPRGGCYYLNDAGVKVYVRNKELCTK